MAIYKRGREFELGTTEHNSSKWPERDSNPRPPDCESDALTTRPRCLPLCVNSISPIRYDFLAGAKAVLYSVNMALERSSYGLEMKTREQDRNRKRTKIQRFDWFVERIQTRVAFGWLSERSDEKTSCPRTFMKSIDTSL